MVDKREVLERIQQLLRIAVPLILYVVSVNIFVSVLEGLDILSGRDGEVIVRGISLSGTLFVLMFYNRIYEGGLITFSYICFKDLKWICGAVVLLLSINLAFGFVAGLFGWDIGSSTLLEEQTYSISYYVALGVVSATLVPLVEEVIFRGFIQTSITESFNPRVGILASSLLFSVIHFSAVSSPTIQSILSYLTVVFFISLVLGYVYDKRNNILVPCVSHGTYNLILVFLSWYSQSSFVIGFMF